MEAKKSENRKVILTLLEGLRGDEGWWYRLPKYNNNVSFNTDPTMPHLGTAFGLSEDAMALILVEMGCLTIREIKDKKFTTHVDTFGWGNLKSEAKLPKFLEIEESKIEKQKNHFVRLGSIANELYSRPARIQKAYREAGGDLKKIDVPKHLALGSRTVTRLIKTKFIQILKSSEYFDDLLSMYDDGPASIATSNRRLVAQALEDENLSHESETEEEEEVSTNESARGKQKVAGLVGAYSYSDGNPCDPCKYPVLHHFKIPRDNPETLKRLVDDIQKLQAETTTETKGVFNNKEIKTLEGTRSLYVRVIQQCNSRSAAKRFNSTVLGMIKKAGKNDKLKGSYQVKQLCLKLSKEYPVSFLQAATTRGYCTQKTPKMTPEFYVAMADAANLNTTQQKTINQYLAHHFGARVCPPFRAIREIGADYERYDNVKIEVDGKDVWYSTRSPYNMFMKNKDVIFDSNAKHIEKIEMLLGGDHGKGAFAFVVIIVVRYKKESGLETKFIDVQIGEIDSTKDTVEHLRKLLDMLGNEVKKLLPKDEKRGVSYAVPMDDGQIQFKSKEWAEQQDNSINSYRMDFYLIGDLKFLFMVVGRANHSTTHCLYCMLKKALWVDKHNGECHPIHCGADKWTIEKLIATIDSGQDLTDLGIKEKPLWDFIPVENIVFPTLHVQIGVSNDLLDNFCNWMDEFVERLTKEEYEARSNSLIAECNVDDQQELLESAQQAVENILEEKSQLLEMMEEPSIPPDQKGLLDELLEDVESSEADAHTNCIAVENELKKRKQQMRNAKKIEKELRKKRSKLDKPLRTAVFEVMEKEKVSMSSYHGGDMEGPATRELSGNGETIFNKIAKCMKERRSKLSESELQSDNQDIDMYCKPEEIEQKCEKYGEAFVLLDSIFSLLNTRRGEVTDDICNKLKANLNKLLKTWIYFGLSITPKMHTLLDHSIEFLRRTEGFHDMGESRVEKYHQYRERIRASTCRLRARGAKMDSQARIQGLKSVRSVQDIQNDVKQKAKRRFTNPMTAWQKKLLQKKKEREERRDKILEKIEVYQQSNPAAPQTNQNRPSLKRKHKYVESKTST